MSVCPICDIDGLELIAWRGKNQCGHQFCKSCVIDWMFATKHPTCPLCRDPIRDDSEDSDDSEEWNDFEESTDHAVQHIAEEMLETTFRRSIVVAICSAVVCGGVEFIKRILL